MIGTEETEEKKAIENKDLKVLRDGHGLSQPLPVPKRLYSLKEASIYLGRTLWGVRELVWAGKLPIVRTGKRQFVDLRDMDRFIEQNKVTYP
jgi:hypothetical protein